jgi:hypothetical protein
MKEGLGIEALGAEILRQQKNKNDYIIDTRRLEMAHDSGVFLRILDDQSLDAVEPVEVNRVAHRQIGTHLSIPAKYYDRMLHENPELLATNVNSWFRKDASTRMLRTMDGTARAFLSNRYHRIDHFEILQAILPVIGEMQDARFESCQITDSRMYIKVLNPRLQNEVVPGDIVQAGIMITNSETGMGAVSVQPLVFRLICSNGMVVNDAKTRRNHVGRANASDENYLLYTDKTIEADDRAFLMKVRDTVRAAVDEVKFGRVVNLMRDAVSAKMNTTDIPAVVRLASKDYGLNENEENGVLSRLLEDHDYSLYGLSNAVTRHSRDVADYDRATDLETVGYEMLCMDRRQWNRLNQADRAEAA